ncbi:MAG: NADH-quinone oxidoreductase subunit C [Betaproteobacteria bacterium]|nr:MAG: NADH-quinone oxidoreductase subunit C [Betaproteobacteria bacterium]TMH42427.1 MAG: NADH-quinone oxidoreductase subunit C [Betaproteobacteria bacterium]
MTPRLQKLHDALVQAGVQPRERLNELTLEVPAADYRAVAERLRDEFAFEELIDLCGVDYAAYGDRPREGPRFAAVVHLLSVSKNLRLRVRAFCPDDEFPVLASLVDVWPAANWFEREAFDLYGIVFEGHPDLRRILTDYGFVGHPFRKDFPLSGHVEMRYDPEQKRVVYEPVTIDPREVTPRIVREAHYADTDK